MTELKGGDMLALGGAVALIAVGTICISMAVQSNVEFARNRASFEDSGAAARAVRAVAEPTPIWVARAVESTASQGAQFSVTRADSFAATPPKVPVLGIQPTPDVAGQWSDVTPIDAGFRFLEPPQPGAHAEIWVRVSAPGPRQGAFTLAIPLAWLDGHRIEAARPRPLKSENAGSERRLTYIGLQPGIWTVALDLVSTAEGVDPPTVRVERVDDARLVGEAHPRTVAPPPNPGPVSALRIERIGLNVAVVPTAWEPPPFLVGQLKSSAMVTEGNTVLVGHLTGAAGAVFSKLDELLPGDPILAVSRGVEYNFVVSDKQILPAADSGPIAPDTSPRLTLMTCTGTWDPIARNYSDRLWVTAELPGPAATTIAANARRPRPLAPARATDAGEMDPEHLRSLIAPAGLGSDRASFDNLLGPAVGETPGKLVVYRQGSTEYHVAFTPDPPRAQLIEIVPQGTDATLDVPAAVKRSRGVFPADAVPLIPGTEATGDLVVERFGSPALAWLLDKATGNAEPGDFVSVYARGPRGDVRHVIIAAGNDPIEANNQASR